MGWDLSYRNNFLAVIIRHLLEGTREPNSRVAKCPVLAPRVPHPRKPSEPAGWCCRSACGLEASKVNGPDSEAGKRRAGSGGVGAELRV